MTKLLTLEQATVIHRVASAACRMYLERRDGHAYDQVREAGRRAILIAMADDLVFEWPDLVGAWTYGIVEDMFDGKRSLDNLDKIKEIIVASALSYTEKGQACDAIDTFGTHTLYKYESFSKNPPILPYLVNQATYIHDRQYRKDDITPFVVHPYRVAMWSALLCDGAVLPALVSIAHDFEEDCRDENRSTLSCVKNAVTSELGDDVWYNVWYNVQALTKNPSLKRNARVVDAAERILAAGNVAKACKMCDIFDNLLDLDALDPKFAVTFVQERLYLIGVLLNLNEPAMWDCGSPLKFRWMSELIHAAISNATATHMQS